MVLRSLRWIPEVSSSRFREVQAGAGGLRGLKVGSGEFWFILMYSGLRHGISWI